jgi:hypothetical protein
MRCVGDGLAHSAHSTRPQYTQTATASVWCAEHFILRQNCFTQGRNANQNVFSLAKEAKLSPKMGWPVLCAGVKLD